MKYLIAILSIFFSTVSFAQNNFFSQAKSVTLDYNDAPVRTVLEQMLKQSNIKNYVISNEVEGVITLKLENHNFESALKIVMRANKVPLLYKIENNILIIERRRESILIDTSKLEINTNEETNSSWQVITLNHIDPLDLQIIFGPILNMNQFSRYKTNNFTNNQNNQNNNLRNGNNNNRNRNR